MLNWVWIFSWGQQTNHSYGSHCQGYHNYNAKIKAKSQNLNLQQRMVPHHTKNVKPFFIIFYSYIFQEEFCLMRQNRLSIGRYDLHLKLKYIMNRIKLKRKSVSSLSSSEPHLSSFINDYHDISQSYQRSQSCGTACVKSIYTSRLIWFEVWGMWKCGGSFLFSTSNK